MNKFIVDEIEYYISRNPYTGGPMIARIDGLPIENRKEICRRFLRNNGWTDDMFKNRITNDLERKINQILNDTNFELKKISSYKSNRNVVYRKTKVSIPKPTNEEVDYWLKAWDSLPDYTVQEEAINEPFQGQYNSNKSLKNIIIKCSVLNDFYSTNIFKVYPVACHILELDIDKRLKQGDISLVNEIANNKIANKEKNFYSFASKYCSHHNQEEYPIYDSYVDQMLRHFRNVDRFVDFDNEDLKDYKKFKNILLDFRKFYKLDKYSLKELDKYLWQAGKKYYPKKYYKK